MDEILIHIAASTTRRNDDIYRSLANTYLDFEPLQARDHGNEVERNEPDGPSASGDNEFALARANIRSSTSDIPLSLSSKESYGSFPSHISLGNHGRTLETSTLDNSLNVASQPVEEGNRLEQLEHIQSNWRRQTRSRKTVSSNRKRGEEISSCLLTADTTFLEDSQLAVAAMESQLHEHVMNSADETSEDDALYMSHKNSEAFNRVEGVAEVEAILETESEEGFYSSRPSLPPASTIGHPRPALSFLQSSNPVSVSTLTPDFHDLPFEVFAPPPAISVDSPGQLPSQVTQYLTTIRQRNSEKFQPSRNLRPLEMDERGYWLVESGKWPRSAQFQLWSTLRDHIQRGDLGWGISLHRSSSSLVIDQVKVYCWGEVVEHIWLCLWLYSKGKITGSGCRWFDAGDNLVIQAA